MSGAVDGGPRARLRAPLLTILTGVIAIALVSWGFLAGIDAALSGSGSGAGPFIALFVLGAVMVIATVVSAVLGLFSRDHRVLWSIALVLGLLPVIAVVVLAVNARG
jgi:uncharacterized membrane protein HdeD (DUF308 family)